MLPIFDGLRDFTFLSVLLRIVFVFISAGLIGFERGLDGRAAGLRTHMLVALGACIVMCTNQYLLLTTNPNADPARLGAQVINGIGFLGAGTILATGKRVTGLTTAAGLWTMACVGLAYGCGFFEGGILTTLVMLIVLILLHRLEGHTSTLVGMELLLEIEHAEDIPVVLDVTRICGGRVVNVSINDNPQDVTDGHLLIRLSLKVGRTFNSTDILNALSQKISVIHFEEL